MKRLVDEDVSVPRGGADPGRGAERLTGRLFEPWTGCVKADSEPLPEGCGPGANCENRGQRPQLQWRLGRLRGCFGSGSTVAVGR